MPLEVHISGKWLNYPTGSQKRKKRQSLPVTSSPNTFTGQDSSNRMTTLARAILRNRMGLTYEENLGTDFDSKFYLGNETIIKWHVDI